MCNSQLLLALSAVLLAAAQAVGGVAVDPSHYPPDVAQLMDFTTDPCTDFYQYSCGGWLANTTLPSTSTAIFRAITSITNHNDEVLAAIFNNNNGSTNSKMAAFYQNCMDTDTINALGLTDYTAFAYTLTTISSLDDVFSAVGWLHASEVPTAFMFSIVIDPGNPSTQIVELDQGGFALPDPTMYQDAGMMATYQQHIANMFTLLGDTAANASAATVIAMESAFAAINLPSSAIQNPLSVYNKIDLEGLMQIAPDIPWVNYIRGLGSSESVLTSINVAEPAFFQAFNKVANQFTPAQWKVYLQWSLLTASANMLPTAFVKEHFAFFGTIVNGQTDMDPWNVTCIQATDAALGDIVGAAYAAAAFGADSKTVTSAMIQGIIDGFHSVLLNATWLDDTTRAAALTKLGEVTRRIGYPDSPSTYPGYEVIAGHYFVSTMIKQAYDFNTTLASYGQAPNPNKWQMTADTVNAYYNPTDNSINFPAGILQDPYFLISRNPAQNFGGAGVIMGHELTHGFDDQGRMYDGHGKLQNWWQNSTAEQFAERSQCMVEQYSGFEVLPGLYVNGNQTIGENIADNGGVHNSYLAYTAWANLLKQTADYPLMFVEYAQCWCSKATDNYLRLLVDDDVHSPPKFRVIGPLQNFQPFADTFQCKSGSYMNPTNKCVIW